MESGEGARRLLLRCPHDEHESTVTTRRLRGAVVKISLATMVHVPSAATDLFDFWVVHCRWVIAFQWKRHPFPLASTVFSLEVGGSFALEAFSIYSLSYSCAAATSIPSSRYVVAVYLFSWKAKRFSVTGECDVKHAFSQQINCAHQSLQT
jgi:hypothetical protein